MMTRTETATRLTLPHVFLCMGVESEGFEVVEAGEVIMER